NQVLYTPMCYKNGTIVDDLLCYRIGEEHYYFIINSANHDKDLDWLKENAEGYDLEILRDISPGYSLFAVQGPNAEKAMQKLVSRDMNKLKFFRLWKDVKIDDIDVDMISRTGYTGEDGVEILVKNKYASRLWKMIMEAGKEYGIKPCGLGARDTLRLEAKLMLYGNDIDDTTTPVEAALKWTVDLDKDTDFNGKEVIKKQIENGTDRILKGFEMIDRGIPRHNMEIYNTDGDKIGYVTSGNYAPYLKKTVGLGYIDRPYHKRNTEIMIDIRGKKKKAKIVKTPFYKKSYKK
ncbi:MAG: glycine cleavage system aminomethyltransferase GcvT, partial [Candidatus Mcinerneyibacterium aminivorans]